MRAIDILQAIVWAIDKGDEPRLILAENSPLMEQTRELLKPQAPHTVTLKCGEKEWELPVPESRGRCGGARFIWIKTSDDEAEEKWLAALREIANGEGGQ